MGGLSLWHWLIVLVIVVLVFGTKRLKNVGKDLGEAVKGFKDGVRDADETSKPPAQLSGQPPADSAAPTDAPPEQATPRSDGTSGDDHSPR